MEQDPTRICELLVGLGDVDVVGVDDEATEPLVVHIQTRSRPVCGGCGGLVWSKGTSLVRLVDLPAFGRAVRLVWHKWRWRCPAAGCGVELRSPRPTTRSHRFFGVDDPCGALGDNSGGS